MCTLVFLTKAACATKLRISLNARVAQNAHVDAWGLCIGTDVAYTCECVKIWTQE